MKYDEVFVSNVLEQYLTLFLKEKQTLESIFENIDLRLIVNKSNDVSVLINQVLIKELENIKNNFNKIYEWWNQYYNSMNELNNGFNKTVNDISFYNHYFSEVKNIYNELE